jgi:hypothetical protein
MHMEHRAKLESDVELAAVLLYMQKAALASR